jgi:hypothetical protein
MRGLNLATFIFPPLKMWHGRPARDPFSSVVAGHSPWAIPLRGCQVNYVTAIGHERAHWAERGCNLNDLAAMYLSALHDYEAASIAGKLFFLICCIPSVGSDESV